MKTPSKILKERYRKDANGTPLKEGDILIEITGQGKVEGWFNGELFYCYHIWQYWGQHGSKGYCYSWDGKLNEFWHVCPEHSHVLNPKKLPKGFLYSFKHGFTSFNSPSKENPYDAIAKSDWDQWLVTPDVVKHRKKIYKEYLKNKQHPYRSKGAETRQTVQE